MSKSAAGSGPRQGLIAVVIAVGVVLVAFVVVAAVMAKAIFAGQATGGTPGLDSSADPATAPVVTSGDTPTSAAPTTVRPASSTSAHEYTFYANDHYGFSIEYPSSFVLLGSPVEGEGAVFGPPDRSATLTVSAIQRSASVASEYDALAKLHTFAYHAKGDDWFVATWTQGNAIVYQKEYVQPGFESGMVFAMVFQYPKSSPSSYSAIVSHLEKTFAVPR